MTKNYEDLYNKLKLEYESSKKDNDEICKEYESTIEMLSDSIKEIKKEKEILLQKLSKQEQEQKNLKKEKDSLMNKNKDKIIDIQNLHKQNDRLSEEIQILKVEKNLFDSKIVSLENLIEHLQNKIREFEVLSDDLENQLESALEENITLQTEYETFKQKSGEVLIRKDDEIRDIKNDLINKEKYIQKLQRGNNALLVKNIRNNIKECQSKEEKRRFTILPGSGGLMSSNLLAFQKTLESNNCLNIDGPNEKTNKINQEIPINDNIMKLNNKLKARKTVIIPRLGAFVNLVQKKEKLRKSIVGITNPIKTDNNILSRNNNSHKSLVSNNSFKTLTNKLDDVDEKSDEFSSSEKEFKSLKICKEENFDFISIGKNNKNIENGGNTKFNFCGNELAIIDDLQNILGRVRKRKDKLMNQRTKYIEMRKKLMKN